MAASSKNQLLAKKGAELIMLQREQQTIQAVMSMVKDQINRLKVCSVQKILMSLSTNNSFSLHSILD